MILKISEFYLLKNEILELLKSKASVGEKLELTELRNYVDFELKSSNEIRLELFKKYGNNLGGGNYEVVDAEAIKGFNEDWKEILDVQKDFKKEFDVNKFTHLETNGEIEIMLKISSK